MTRIVQRPFDIEKATQLIADGFSPALARALAARGIASRDDLLVDWQGLLAPHQLEGTREAAIRLAQARERGELVTIVADYDCDGATACSIAMKGLTQMGIRVNYFVPDRVTQGYGLTPSFVDMIHERSPETRLIVTVDNGISSIKAVEQARQYGIDVIITDHHLPGDVEPQALAIVNPNRKGSTFASKNLAGVGVMYYVLLALRAYLREQGVYDRMTQPRLDALVDLVALGTVADVVKLDKNNRILVAQGLKRIRQGLAQPGIQALFSIAGRKPEEASVRDFGFAIGPRINAAGRLSSMQNGIECLLSSTETTALAFARELNAINSERRELETNMQQIAEAAVEAQLESHRATLCLRDEEFNEGVVGLVASRIKDRIHRPVFAFAPADNQTLKGSGRSIPGIHLRDMLAIVNQALPGAIVRFGGHAAAAGLTLNAAFYEDFCRLLEDTVKAHTEPHLFERIVYADGGLKATEINESLITSIDQLIWGQGFEAPIFANDFTVRRQTVLKDAHLKLTLEHEGALFDAIFFRRRDPLAQQVTLAYRPTINEFMGRRSIQLVIEAADE